MSALSDLFGGDSTLSQLFIWQVVGQVVGTLLEPILNSLGQEAWQSVTEGSQGVLAAPPSPQELADWVVRNFIDQSDAEGAAARSGTNAADFQRMVDNAGEGPAPEQLAAALRRGIIALDGTGADSTSFEQGIAEGRLHDKWASVIQALAVEWPTPNDALRALLQGQVSEADGQALYEKFGGDPDYFELQFNTNGNAPTPVEALRMANRGIIPWSGSGAGVVSFEQAFLEGPWRNKWLPAFEQLGQYIPPPRTVSALEKLGVISAAEAQTYYQAQGMSTDLAAAYSKSASIDKVAGSKLLQQGLVLTLFDSGAITTAQATTYLNDLGYDDIEAAYILQVQELQTEVRALHSAITKVGSLYVGHKVTHAGAVAALNDLGVSAEGQTKLLATWNIEATANVKSLTESQIAQAFYYQVMTQDEAMTELQNIGYTPFDAWVILSNTQQAALPGQPGQGPAGPGVNP